MPIVPRKTFTAKIVEWDDQKGYGFLEVGDGKVFLHRRDFAEWHKRPEIGDLIRFAAGRDAAGRTCAVNATHVNDGGKLTVRAGMGFVALLVLPCIALYRGGVDLRLAGAYFLIIGALTYGGYAADKRMARNNQRRIPESMLHLLELMGGWTGAFIAQRRLRHKCSKTSYQITFWLIILAHQFVALDSLLHWKLYLRTLEYIGRPAGSPRPADSPNSERF